LENIMTFLQYFSPFILIECIEPPTWAPREQLHKSLRGNYMAWVKWEPMLLLFSTKKILKALFIQKEEMKTWIQH
jgi:aspartate carbamoyltransferase catalytic subunit